LQRLAHLARDLAAVSASGKTGTLVSLVGLGSGDHQDDRNARILATEMLGDPGGTQALFGEPRARRHRVMFFDVGRGKPANGRRRNSCVVVDRRAARVDD
jgi:hypothetical protein